MSGSLFLRTRSRDEDSCETKRIAVFSLSFFSSALSRRKKNETWSLVHAHPHTALFRRGADGALQQPFGCGPDGDSPTSATQTDVRARLRAAHPRSSPPGPRPRRPRAVRRSLARANVLREKRASRSRAVRVTPPTATLRQRRDAKAERLRAKAASALGARSPLLDSLLVHPLS